VNVWCGVNGDRLIRPCVFYENLMGDTYEEFLRKARVKKCKFALSNPCILVLMYMLIRECIGKHDRQAVR
jgi:hypothetical protein